MEILDSLLADSIRQRSQRECRARVTRACLDRGGHLEAGRRGNARYCFDCAPIVRSNKSKLGKRKLRKNLVYRKHQREYRKQRREKHARYMRCWRARRKPTSSTRLKQPGPLAIPPPEISESSRNVPGFKFSKAYSGFIEK